MTPKRPTPPPPERFRRRRPRDWGSFLAADLIAAVDRDRGGVLAGNWDGDGCDTVAVFSKGEVYISNTLPSTGATFAAEQTYRFGSEFSDGRRPFSGDFNGDGKDTVGVHHNVSTAKVHLNYVAPTGPVASVDQQFWYGTHGDKVFVGDWTGDVIDTVGVFRTTFGIIGRSVEPGAFFFRFTNTTGFADRQYSNYFGEYGRYAQIYWNIVSGDFSSPPGSWPNQADGCPTRRLAVVGSGRAGRRITTRRPHVTSVANPRITGWEG